MSGLAKCANDAFLKQKRADFTTWFHGSKVTDSSGAALMVFHCTANRFCPTDFKPFSHFGTSDAANWFADKYIPQEKSPVIFPVFLHLKNPLELRDIGHHKSKFIIKEIYNKIDCAAEKSEIEYLFPDINSCMFGLEKDDPQSIQAVIRYLSQKGYDGLKYKNDFEDKGSISYMIFSPAQVYPALGLGNELKRISVIYKQNPAL